MIKNLRDQVEPIIKEAGAIQLSYFAKARLLDRREKDGEGFVTEADLETEKFLIKKLSQVFPGAAFCAEESGITGNGEYRWVIDPLDGTTNFGHGLPYFCISVALTRNDEPFLGVIYQPILDELFWAQQGEGAWLNGERISVSNPSSLDQSLLVVGIPYSANGNYEDFLQQMCATVPKAYAFRHLGAAALDLAYVACGRLDGMFFSGLSWWDFAAGDLLIREAGGRTTDFEGNSVCMTSQNCVAGSPLVHKSLLELLPG